MSVYDGEDTVATSLSEKQVCWGRSGWANENPAGEGGVRGTAR